MIEGELEGIEFLKAEKERLKISDETIEILYKAVGIHEQAFNPGFKSYNPEKSNEELRSLEEKLKVISLSRSKGGNKKYFTGKIKKRVSKKERQKRKSKKKTK